MSVYRTLLGFRNPPGSHQQKMVILTFRIIASRNLRFPTSSLRLTR